MKLEKYKEPIENMVCITGTKHDSFFGWWVTVSHPTPLIVGASKVKQGDVFYFTNNPDEIYHAVGDAFVTNDQWGVPCNL